MDRRKKKIHNCSVLISQSLTVEREPENETLFSCGHCVVIGEVYGSVYMAGKTRKLSVLEETTLSGWTDGRATGCFSPNDNFLDNH